MHSCDVVNVMATARLICLILRSCWTSPTTGCSARLWTIQITHFINSSLHCPQHRSTTIWDDVRMTDSCQLKLVSCVIKTSLHEHCIKTVIKFLLVCIVYPELSGVLLRYVSFTNKEWMNEWIRFYSGSHILQTVSSHITHHWSLQWLCQLGHFKLPGKIWFYATK